MAEVYLEFEKPISELKNKLAEWEKLASDSENDFSSDVNSLRQKLDETVKNIFANLTPWQRVQLARHPERPYTLDYIERIFTDFLEFHGDRRYSDDNAIVGGFAKLDGKPVMIIGTQKGRDVKTNMMRNFGWPHPEGYRKALRLMQLANKVNVPIITFVDTPGAFPGIASEERHIGEAIAVNMREMFGFTVPIISVIIGEGGSGGAIGIGVGNKVLIMENAYYSVITPEGCAAILWKNRSFADKAATSLRLTAKDLIQLKVADDVIPEPLGGAHRNYDEVAENMRVALLANLEELTKLTPQQLQDGRYAKFRQMGQIIEQQESNDEQ